MWVAWTPAPEYTVLQSCPCYNLILLSSKVGLNTLHSSWRFCDTLGMAPVSCHDTTSKSPDDFKLKKQKCIRYVSQKGFVLRMDQRHMDMELPCKKCWKVFIRF